MEKFHLGQDKLCGSRTLHSVFGMGFTSSWPLKLTYFALDHRRNLVTHKEQPSHNDFHLEQYGMPRGLRLRGVRRERVVLQGRPEGEKVSIEVLGCLLVAVSHTKQEGQTLEVRPDRVGGPGFAEHQLENAVEDVHVRHFGHGVYRARLTLMPRMPPSSWRRPAVVVLALSVFTT